jgi:hypothetical protein
MARRSTKPCGIERRQTCIVETRVSQVVREKRKSVYLTFVMDSKKTLGSFAALDAALLFGMDHYLPRYGSSA